MEKPKRKFNIVDLMILAAFTALGAAWYVVEQRSEAAVQVDPFDLDRTPTPPPPTATPAFGVQLIVRAVASLPHARFFLFTWLLAFFALKARKPRPRLRRMLRSPATSACTAILILMLTECLLVTANWTVQYWPRRSEMGILTSQLLNIPVEYPSHAGLVIIPTWLILWLARSVAFERNWLELFGLFVGVGWILLLFSPLCWTLIMRLGA